METRFLGQAEYLPTFEAASIHSRQKLKNSPKYPSNRPAAQ